MPLTSVDLTPRIGSKMRTDAASLLGGEHAAEIRDLLECRGVLIARDLEIPDPQLLAIAQTLGLVRLGTMAKEGTEGIKSVTFDRSANPATAEYFKGAFYSHMDGTYDDVPPRAAVLVPRLLAPDGGETEFANTYAAYDDLPEADKTRFEDLQVEHAMAAAHRLYTPEPSAEQFAHWNKFPSRTHPLVWTHQSGRKFSQIFAEGLWWECKQHGVDVLHMAVGTTDTPAMQRLGITYHEGEAVTASRVAEHTLANIANGPVFVMPELRGGSNSLQRSIGVEQQWQMPRMSWAIPMGRRSDFFNIVARAEDDRVSGKDGAGDRRRQRHRPGARTGGGPRGGCGGRRRHPARSGQGYRR